MFVSAKSQEVKETEQTKPEQKTVKERIKEEAE
jgi:hypothetical protein